MHLSQWLRENFSPRVNSARCWNDRQVFLTTEERILQAGFPTCGGSLLRHNTSPLQCDPRGAFFIHRMYVPVNKKKTSYPKITGLNLLLKILFANVWHKSNDRRRSYPQRTMPLKIKIFTIITYVLSYHFCTVLSIFLCQNLCQIPQKRDHFSGLLCQNISYSIINLFILL